MGRKKIADTPARRSILVQKLLADARRNSSRCKIWTRAKNNHGYGIIRYAGRNWFVHRLVFDVINGGIPPKMFVCHRCDTPGCFNPKHLFLGTQKDNMADASAKGRIRLPNLRGQKHPQAKLTATQVAEIRYLYGLGRTTQTALGERFNVTQAMISAIVTGKNW